MLMNGSRLINFPILSLHVGGAIARTARPVINPDNLKIIAYETIPTPLLDEEAGEILETRDVREFANVGMIVDSGDVFVNRGDVIKLDKILDLNFDLIGLKVETKKGTKLGKVLDYTVNTDDFSVLQLIIKRPAMKAFLDPELVIPKKEIVEITDYKVIVKDEEDKIRKKAVKENFVPNFVNPFREPDFSSSRVDRHN
ncbi:PRC-barrel domain-containing protein [Candidatus Saccharibacteria bacterium]|nr:PRC-barrel domain-containing protein [Candidatus Saccharibacteria bacterium]MBQ6147460.1 PRC-barrel domain-containing protein [Candidatus Saccharibacteria bacterium]MBQ6605386.1 PRC-barrel domain-containing protein [Candidatus Saccharibacteria bacterium]